MRDVDKARLTFEDAVEIHRLLNAGMFQHSIAAIYGVNPGRINEIKKGHKFPGSADAAKMPRSIRDHVRQRLLQGRD